MAIKKETEAETKLVLTPQEEAAIEAQRAEVEKLRLFRDEYQKLVEQTGFMWVVDGNSPLNNIQLGIAKKG